MNIYENLICNNVRNNIFRYNENLKSLKTTLLNNIHRFIEYGKYIKDIDEEIEKLKQLNSELTPDYSHGKKYLTEDECNKLAEKFLDQSIIINSIIDSIYKTQEVKSSSCCTISSSKSKKRKTRKLKKRIVKSLNKSKIKKRKSL